MKKVAFVALLAMLTIYVNAQVLYNDDREELRHELNTNAKYHKHLADNHITDIKQYAYSHKHPNGLLCFEYKYDLHGNTVEIISWNKRGVMKTDYRYQYDDSNRRIAGVGLNKKGIARSGEFWSYDKRGNIIQFRTWWKDTGNVRYSYTTEFNYKNNPVQAKIYYSGHKLYSTAIYEYYDDGSKKKTTTYNRNGKVTGVWNYDCNPVGQSQESKMKDTSKICVHYETDKNGNPVKIKEEYTEGGGLFKYRLRNISKYNKDNSLIEQITMKMNGKQIRHFSTDYNTNGNMTEWCEYVPNSTTLKKHWVYVYNNSGDLTQATLYSKAFPAGSVIKYVYN